MWKTERVFCCCALSQRPRRRDPIYFLCRQIKPSTIWQRYKMALFLAKGICRVALRGPLLRSRFLLWKAKMRYGRAYESNGYASSQL
jgi:hypothetical protein